MPNKEYPAWPINMTVGTVITTKSLNIFITDKLLTK